MKKIFVDSDIILDLFAQRDPFHAYAAELFSLIDSGKIRAFTSPIVFANLHYILRKLQNKNQAIKSLQKLKALVNILPVDGKIIDLALASGFKDFEDSIQYYAAVENGIQYLITRNVKDYKKADITILTAEEYLNLLRSK
ncbi:MAG: PIN domain-containing protein [bacterium]|nr:PIN domain-containing protein [bacterium]